MANSRGRELLRKVVAAISVRDSAAIERHVNEISELGMDEVEELMQTDKGMQYLAGPLLTVTSRQIRSPKFSELVEAVPGRMSDEEYVKVLSGGTRHQWGPWRRLAEKLIARFPRK